MHRLLRHVPVGRCAQRRAGSVEVGVAAERPLNDGRATRRSARRRSVSRMALAHLDPPDVVWTDDESKRRWNVWSICRSTLTSRSLSTSRCSVRCTNRSSSRCRCSSVGLTGLVGLAVVAVVVRRVGIGCCSFLLLACHAFEPFNR